MRKRTVFAAARSPSCGTLGAKFEISLRAWGKSENLKF